MWVRSLSLPPPHPLVLTGKGRSFLQPQLPPPPTETLSLSLCVLCVSRASQRPRLFAAFTADPCGGLSHRHWFLWSCAVLFSLFFPLSFWVRWGLGSSFLVYSLYFVSAAICMVLCISNLGHGHTHGADYTAYTYTGVTPSLFLHERPPNITNRCVIPHPHPTPLHPTLRCPTPLKPSCLSLHSWSSL